MPELGSPPLLEDVESLRQRVRPGRALAELAERVAAWEPPAVEEDSW